MKKIFQSRMTRRGAISLPKQWLQDNNIKPGDRVSLIDLGDGILVLNSHRARLDKIANQLSREWQEPGESLESMLTTLRKVRTEWDREQPKDKTS